jgi:hypothetical protein
MHENHTTTVYTDDPGYKRYAVLGAVVIVLLIASNAYLYWQLNNVRHQVGDMTTNFATEMRPVFGLGKGRDVSLWRDSHAS